MRLTAVAMIPERLAEGVPHHELVEEPRARSPAAGGSAPRRGTRRRRRAVRTPPRADRTPDDATGRRFTVPGDRKTALKPSSSTQRRASRTAPADVVRREHRRHRTKRVGMHAAEVVQPVVVGAGYGGGELGLESVRPHLLRHVEPQDEEPARREQHAEIEPLRVHRLASAKPGSSRAARRRRTALRFPPSRRFAPPAAGPVRGAG